MDPDCEMSSSKRPTRPTCEHMNDSGPTEVSCVYIYIYILVGGFNPLEKILVSWGYYSQYMENMFQTTNQYIYIYLEFIPSTAAHHGLLSVKSPCVPCFFIHHLIFTFFFNFLTLCRVIQTLLPILSMMSKFKNENKNISRFSQDPHHFPRCFPGISKVF